LLSGIISQGWGNISIRLVEARTFDNVVLIENILLFGSGALHGKRLVAKSIQVLTKIGRKWAPLMHTAT
jgi:hypothetical protein